MAYGVKYRLEFTDIQQDDWKVDILEDSYAGAISAMSPSGKPLTIEWLTPSDDLTLGPIKGSMATINVECTTNFEYIGLYDEEDLVRPVNVYKNDILYWTGWLSNEYSEPYDNVPYTVSITAADGLGILKNIAYKDGGDDYTGRVSADTIIKIVLGHLGHTSYIEYCNVYEDRMDDAVDDSVFDQELIDNDLFVDADCYSVLSAILSKLNAVIRQSGGQFIIYRPVELVGDLVYGRIITALATTGTSIVPDRIINRSGMDLIDVEGGVLMYQEPMSKFTVSQDYGVRESWIKNHNIDISTWQGYLAGNNRFTDWVNNYPIGPLGHYSATSKETEGVLFSVGGNMAQTFGTYARTCSDEMIFSFDYLLINFDTSPIATCDVSVMIYDSTGAYWLTNSATEGEAEWTTTGYSAVNVTVDDIPVGVSPWTTATFRFTGLPIDGPYNIIIGWTGTSDTGVAFKGLRFYATSDDLTTISKKVAKWANWANAIPPFGIIKFFGGGYYDIQTRSITDNEEVVEREYVVDNAIQGADRSQAYILGDCEDTKITNVLEQFKGALAIMQTGSLTQSAIDFVNAHQAAYLSGGVDLTSSGENIYFESRVAGSNFTGSTTFTRTSGDIAGVVTTLQANVAAVSEVDTVKVNLTSPSGTANVTCKGLTKLMTYSTNVPTTVSNFVTANQAAYAAVGVTLAIHGTTNTWMTFTGVLAGASFGSATTIVNVSGTLSGTVEDTVDPVFPRKRKDQITLSGTGGTADILCDGTTRGLTFNTDVVMDFTSSWHTRGNTEAKPLAELIGDEVAAMYSKGRHFIQMSLYELTDSLNVIDNLQDPLNVVGANNRVFAFNRGKLDCKMREWTADFIEIGDK